MEAPTRSTPVIRLVRSEPRGVWSPKNGLAILLAQARSPEKGVRMTQEVSGLGTDSPREGRICIAFPAVTVPPEVEARVRGRRL